MSKQPKHTIEVAVSSGKIGFAIWKNNGGYAVSYNRSFHSGEEWKDTKSLRHQDIPTMIMGLQLCYQWIHEQDWRQWKRDYSTGDSSPVFFMMQISRLRTLLADSRHAFLR